jgi:Spy/CpxP family protein refolding chaperone
MGDLELKRFDRGNSFERRERIPRIQGLGLGAIGLAALLVAGASFAGSPFGHLGSHRDTATLIEENAETLDLEPEALTAIRNIIAESKPRGDELHAKLDELHDGMKALLDQDTPDESAVMRQVEAIGAAETQLHKHRLATMLAIRQRLTPEQREKLVEIGDESHGRWKHALRDACEPDVKALCADAADRLSRKRCLVENEAKLSPECADAIAKLHSEHHGGCEHGKSGCAEGGCAKCGDSDSGKGCCAKCGESASGEGCCAKCGDSDSGKGGCAKCGESASGEGCCAKCGESASGEGCCERHREAGSGESCSEPKRE